MRKLIYFIVGIILAIPMFVTTSCQHHVGSTHIMVQDSIRHYFPILQGQKIEMSFRVANIGENPLVLTDIHPSCGCIAVNEESNNVVLPNEEQTLKFIFDSSKYTGFVEHQIYIYGNIDTTGMAILRFDVNVVPPYGSAPDYEEWYYENEKTERILRGAVNGFENERGYWINSGDYPEDYERNYKKYPWRERSAKKK